jgi:hypothetical protein
MRHQLNPATATQWSRQVARPWRAVFLLYVLVLTVGSNWPGMHFRIGEQVSPDKLVHAIAFGGLATLLWRTRWLRAQWQVGLIVLVWAAAAELVQVLPIFRRTLSIEDMVAGQIGVLLVVAWWWAIAPIGGTASQLRHARRAFIVGGMFLRPRYWIASAGAAGIGAVVMGGGMWMALRLTGSQRYVVTALITAAFAGAVAAVYVTVSTLSRRPRRTLSDDQACFACGASCRGSSLDGFGRGLCPTCTAPIHRGQWVQPVEMPPATVLRGLGCAAVAAASLLVVAACLYGIVRGLSPWVDVTDNLLRSWETLSLPMRYLIELAVVTLALTVAWRVYRARQASVDDRQHLRCRCCHHDLADADVEQGLGRCRRCGAPFVRFPSQPEAVKER